MLKATSSKLITRISILVILTFGTLTFFHRDRLSLATGSRYPPYVPVHTKSQASCPPEEWIKGSWKPKSNYSFPPLKEPNDVYAMAGFERCASNREVDWHFGSPIERPNRFPKVNSYEWHGGCAITPFSAEEMIKDLVKNGGWLLLGDSLTEGHFFSLSCSLGAHVRATPYYPDGHPGNIAYIPQQLFLNKNSTLVPFLEFPKGFDFDKTPLVTFLRCDFLMRVQTLKNLYNSLHNPPSGFRLFREDDQKTSGPEDYMPIFLNPKDHYNTLIVSTAAWWNTDTLTGLRDQDQAIEHGSDNLIQFYSEAMTLWANQVQDALFQDQIQNPTLRRKQAIVRAFPGGHDDCTNHYEPWTVDHGHPVQHYNWPWISIMNERFRDVVVNYLDIHYLDIDHPARLRPDAHAAWDCLHYAGGTGVKEGWTHYIWYYIKNLTARGLLNGPSANTETTQQT